VMGHEHRSHWFIWLYAGVWQCVVQEDPLQRPESSLECCRTLWMHLQSMCWHFLQQTQTLTVTISIPTASFYSFFRPPISFGRCLRRINPWVRHFTWRPRCFISHERQLGCIIYSHPPLGFLLGPLADDNRNDSIVMFALMIGHGL